jgi:transposase-like protein
MIEISFPIFINLSIDGEVTINNITEKINDLEINKHIFNEFFNNLNDLITVEFCGEKYGRVKENKRYERAGNYIRKIHSLLGELDLKIDKIRDTEKGVIFKPLADFLQLDPYKKYQDDIAFTSVDIATKNSYRDTVYIMKNFLKEVLSPSTIYRHVKKYGSDIKEFMKKRVQNKSDNGDLQFFYSDSTKSHSQEEKVKKNDIKVAMTTNEDGEKVLLSCVVNKPWSVLNQEIEELDVLGSDAVLIADAEQGLKNALVNGDREYQLDYIHYIRDIGYYLWKDNKLNLDTRKELKKYAEKIIYTLKNQTIKYGKKKKILKKKINTAVDKLKEFSKYLYEIGCSITAEFVNKYSNYIVTFAILKSEGRDIPYNSNIIERLMGEIQKRCKHKWMRWTTEGQEAILNLILTRYINPQDYEEFRKEKIKSENLKNIKIKIKI